MELIFQQEEKIMLNLEKKILQIAIGVLYIGEDDDDRQIKQCYIWKHKYTREGIAIF